MPNSCKIKQDPSQWETKPTFQLTITFKQTFGTLTARLLILSLSSLVQNKTTYYSPHKFYKPLFTTILTYCSSLFKMMMIIIIIIIYPFQNSFLRCPTPWLHCFLSSHWPSFRFLSFMAFLILSIQFFFALPHALFCFGIHFIQNYMFRKWLRNACIS
jgi:hypothetical protein